MKTKVSDIKTKYSVISFRRQGINTDKTHRHSFKFSDAEENKIALIMGETKLSLSDLIRYSIHYFSDYLTEK